MSLARTGVVCAVCCVAAAAWAGDGRIGPTTGQDVTTLLPVSKLDIAQVFEAADTNHDERVTYEEAHTYNFLVTQSQFNEYDTNLDGYIDRAEAGLPPVDPDPDPDPDEGGCAGCSGEKSALAKGDLLALLLSLLGLAAMAKVGRQ